jgi:hypothetical protein
MQASGLSPHAGVVAPRVVVGWGRTVERVTTGGTVTRRVVVTTGGLVTRRVVVGARRVLVTMVVGGAPHLPERQIISPSQSFSVSHGSPRRWLS